jgi:hypothetical protein
MQTFIEDGGAPRPPPYVPTEMTNDELFDSGYSTGINFNKYDSIKVEVRDVNNYALVTKAHRFKKKLIPMSFSTV